MKPLTVVAIFAFALLARNAQVSAQDPVFATFDGPMTSVPGGPPDRLMSMVRRMLADRLGPRLTRPHGTRVRVIGALLPNFDFSTSCGFKRVGPT